MDKKNKLCFPSFIQGAKVFETKAELQAAVNSCAFASSLQSSACNEVQAKYGWPMNKWKVHKITDMSELFKGKSGESIPSQLRHYLVMKEYSHIENDLNIRLQSRYLRLEC